MTRFQASQNLFGETEEKREIYQSEIGGPGIYILKQNFSNTKQECWLIESGIW
jgi:hypothetical protein